MRIDDANRALARRMQAARAAGGAVRLIMVTPSELDGEFRHFVLDVPLFIHQKNFLCVIQSNHPVLAVNKYSRDVIKYYTMTSKMYRVLYDSHIVPEVNSDKEERPNEEESD